MKGETESRVGVCSGSVGPSDHSLEIRFATAVYDREAVLAACTWLGDRVAFEVLSKPPGEWVVRLRPLDETSVSDLAGVGRDLTSRVADQQLRIDLDRRSAPIRRLVYEYAFGGARRKKRPSATGLKELPFQFRRLDNGAVLLVSAGGEYAFVSDEEFCALRSGTPATRIRRDLQSKHILGSGDVDLDVELLATQLRTRKSVVAAGPALHMIVLTNECNARCAYCHAASDSREAPALRMSQATASRVLDTILASPAPSLTIEFQGGEPTLNWDVLAYVLREVRTRSAGVRPVNFVLCTNLLNLTDAMCEVLEAASVRISTSLDGPASLHDRHRKSTAHPSCHAQVVAAIHRIRRRRPRLSLSALPTITADHAGRWHEVIDAYLELGFTSIFLRPVHPYGRARDDWSRLACAPEVFLSDYRDALDYLLALNRQGTWCSEYGAILLLSRILTPFPTGFVDLQSPAGAGLCGVMYDADGTVFPSDEARMLARSGDRRYAFGSVWTDPPEALFAGPGVRRLAWTSIVESLPGCADCAYHLYCGADPIRYFVESEDEAGQRPTSDFCRIHRGLFDYFFSMLERADEETWDILWSWINGRPRGVA